MSINSASLVVFPDFKAVQEYDAQNAQDRKDCEGKTYYEQGCSEEVNPVHLDKQLQIVAESFPDLQSLPGAKKVNVSAGDVIFQPLDSPLYFRPEGGHVYRITLGSKRPLEESYVIVNYNTAEAIEGPLSPLPCLKQMKTYRQFPGGSMTEFRQKTLELRTFKGHSHERSLRYSAEIECNDWKCTVDPLVLTDQAHAETAGLTQLYLIQALLEHSRPITLREAHSYISQNDQTYFTNASF